MSRYIDADTLKVSITKYGELHISHKKLSVVKNEAKELIRDICFAIDARSTADVVPVVRCKDCECVFQYGKEDVYHQKSLYPSIESNADGSVKVVRYIGSYVNCPECDNPNLLCSEALDPEGK